MFFGENLKILTLPQESAIEGQKKGLSEKIRVLIPIRVEIPMLKNLR